MGVLALVLGIVSLVVFDWLGFVLAGVSMAVGTGASALGGNPEVPMWPMMVFGWGMGVAIPLTSVVCGILAMRQESNKGLGIAGMVIGGVATLIGVILALVLHFGAAAGGEFIEKNKGQMDALTKSKLDAALTQTMNDPAARKQLEEIKKALQQIPADVPAAPPPPAPGAPPAPAAPPAAPPPAAPPPAAPAQ
jgi:hypothetical protein